MLPMYWLGDPRRALKTDRGSLLLVWSRLIGGRVEFSARTARPWLGTKPQPLHPGQRSFWICNSMYRQIASRPSRRTQPVR